MDNTKVTNHIGDEYTIKQCSQDEQNKIISFILSIVESEFPDISGFFSLEDIDNLGVSYSGNRDSFFVLTKDEHIIGTLAIKEDDKDIALLRRFFIHPDYRGKGLGKRMIEKAVHFCRQYGYKTIEFRGLEMMQAARNLLLKSGFKEKEIIENPFFHISVLSYQIENSH